MIHWKYIILGILFPALGSGQHTLQVTITDLPQSGVIYLALYNSEINFLEDEGMIDNQVRELRAKREDFLFEVLPQGRYALSFFVDQNGNKKLDYNFLGFPKEPFGFFKSPSTLFRKPRFSNLSFQLQEDRVVIMKPR